MQAIRNDVIIRKPKFETKITTASGLVLIRDYDSVHGQSVVVDVIAVGPSCKEVKVGDRAMTLHGVGVNFTKDGVEYHRLKEDELLAIVEE